MYLIKEKKRDFADRQFISLTAAGKPGLVITRRHPDRVRRERGFGDSRVIWLSRTPGQDYHDPVELESLAKRIFEFIDESRQAPVILLDGLDYLIVNNGSHQTLMFVENLKELVMRRKAIVLMPVSPDTIEERELADLMRRFPIPFNSTVQVPLGRGRKKFVKSNAPGILLIPTKAGLVTECERLREVLPLPVDIDNTNRSVEEKIRGARRSRIPFIVLVSGGERRLRIAHVILWTGEEAWMSLENLKRAFKEWALHG